MAQRHPLQDILSPLLLPVSKIYGMAGTWRRRYFQQTAVRWMPSCPCISLGNISWGGTGKTPIADWLLSWASKHSLRAAVLTRGYKSHPPYLPFIVKQDTPAASCGDEPLMLALRHPDAYIAVDPVRSRAGKMLEKQKSPDLYLLDDGFQHLAVQRHLDLVLLDQDDIPFFPLPGHESSNWNRVIPVGSWREPVSSLKHAGAYLIKTTPHNWQIILPDLKKRLHAFPRPVFAFCMKAEHLLPVTAGEPSSFSTLCPPQTISGPYCFVCGIGNPAQARETVTSCMGYPPAQEIDFPDHYDFQHSKEQLETLGMPIICTGKDAVKIADLNLSVPCFALDVQAHFFASLNAEQICSDTKFCSQNAPAPDFLTWWEHWWNTHCQR